jgi:hypothetical protein
MSKDFDDTALEALSRMKSLKQIHLIDAHMSKAAVKQWMAEHPALRVEIAVTNQ